MAMEETDLQHGLKTLGYELTRQAAEEDARIHCLCPGAPGNDRARGRWWT
jgi:hypothetical protein